MDSNDILKALDQNKRLIQDEHYYRYIFKKTERIVSVVFYVLHNVPKDTNNVRSVEDIEHAARSVHDAIIQSLETRQQYAEDSARQCVHGLVALESKLHVALVTGTITKAVFETFAAEIDSVLRALSRYCEDGLVLPDETPTIKKSSASASTASRGLMPTQGSTRTPHTVGNPPSAAVETTASQGHRRDRIKTVIEARGEVTIKDISEIVTDCSEKTIQRELNAMIEEGQVIRQGERRWSKYLLSN